MIRVTLVDQKSKPNPSRTVWKGSRKRMLTLLEGALQPTTVPQMVTTGKKWVWVAKVV